jgi:hypothetical protein
MTSPVDTSVKIFSSTMVNAPVLNGVAGALVALLDAVLVTGFDTKSSVSIAVAGGIATATWAGTRSWASTASRRSRRSPVGQPPPG